MNPVRVDIWSDIVCPFCYIGKKRLENVARDAGIELEVHWHSFELDPNSTSKHDSSNTERLAKKYNKSVTEIETMQQHMAEMARDEGVEFAWQKAKSGNSFNAHRISHLAASKGLGDAAQEAFFYAYMTEGLPIGERDVVEQVAARIGLDAAEVKDVLDSDRFSDEVRLDERIAHEQLDIGGVPFFIFNQKIGLSGAQPREVFLQAMQQAIADTDRSNSDSAALTDHEAAPAQPAPICDDESCEIPAHK